MRKAIVVLKDSIHGTITFTQLHKYEEVVIQFNLYGFEPKSVHAIHIHEYGDITDGCKSLGGHFNPTNKVHGHYKQKDHHAGDLFNNILSDINGEFHYTFTTNEISLFDDVKNIVGRSIVIHQFRDDLGLMGLYNENRQFFHYREMNISELKKLCISRGYTCSSMNEMIQKLELESKTTGNAAKRIACGIIGLSK